MADLRALKKQIPIDDIASRLGVSPDVAEEAIDQVLPGLVGGMAENAKDDGGRRSLEKALGRHRRPVPTRVDDIDTEDGERIVANVFGEKKGEVASRLADGSPKSLVTQDLIQRILPIVAPIVLAWLADRFLGGKKEGSAQSGGGNGGGGLGDLLGGILGGAGGGSTRAGGGDLLGGILGGLLGGGKR